MHTRTLFCSLSIVWVASCQACPNLFGGTPSHKQAKAGPPVKTTDAAAPRDMRPMNVQQPAPPLLQAPPFPKGAENLSAVELTELLLQAFRETDRTAARPFLMEALTKKFIFLQDHFEPQKLPAVVYEDTAPFLKYYPPDGRLQGAHWLAFEAHIAELHRVAMSLALARYLREHPKAKAHPAIAEWLEGFHIEQWDALSIPEIAAEATRRRQELDRLDQRARGIDVDAWAQLEDDQWEVEMTLDSARTGQYGDAMGSLYSFLHDIGARVNLHETH
jgi:hypothetical protein